MDYEIPNQFKRSKRKNTTENEQNIVKINTWKCFYVERHLQDILEHLKPENYNSEEMKELIELSRDYIIRLKLNQLQAPNDNNTERIPLQAILPALNNMKQLNICFKQTYVGDDFSWHILQTTPRDIENLGKGLEKCDLEVLRIINTDITCDKVTMLACHLSTNKNLRVLDFSHCKIADKGIVALCKLLQELPNLVELNLMNNFIESKGLEYLCYTLSKPDIKLKQLHLNLNNFGASGANFLARILVENTQLVQLNLSACGLTTDNVALLIKALRTNSTLLHLDLSNNSLNENIGDLFIKLLNSSNLTLQSLDLRMTLIPSETMLMIDEILNHPKRKSSYKYNKRLYKNFKDSSQLSDVNENKNTTEVDDTTTELKDSSNEKDSNSFPPFHNVEDMENQVENVFRVYLNTLKKELNDCCDEYYDENEDSARSDAKQEELIEKSYQENSNSNGDHI
ncbi:uncharacterized protein [Atheta coriaria]|uniref:uncharacterized protein n=1 Tax=Dalotia coriaria TaxID=877792 RepID=UPI0031F3979C